MKNKDILDALNDIDWDMVEDARSTDGVKLAAAEKRKHKVLWTKWTLAAACLCIVVVTAVSTVLITNAISPTPDVGETPGGSVDSENISGDNEKEPPTYNTIEVSDELIEQCINATTNADRTILSYADKINLIKNERVRPIHVMVDPDNYYFVCGYYNSNNILEKAHYGYAREYTWVAFNSLVDIKQYYNGLELICAFQVNKALACYDFISGEKSEINVEVCQRYTPVFYQGLNYEPAIECKRNFNFIYLHSPSQKSANDENTVYFAPISPPISDPRMLTCVFLDGIAYVTYPLESINNYYDEIPQDDIEALAKVYFGEYYDYLMDVMITDKYGVGKESGYITLYGLFRFEDIRKLINYRRNL